MKRKKWIRAAALVLAALLTLGPAASASQVLGTEIHFGKIHLAEGVDYTYHYLWSSTYSDLRTERYLEYSPSDLVQPVVAYGSTVLSRNTLTTMAQGLEAGGKRVLGGINGDYYVVATGAPLGIVVTDGILRSSSAEHYALGFDADGNAFIGQPSLYITATFKGSTLAVAGGLNKVRPDGGYVLYTSEFAATTKHVVSGVDVILSPNVPNASGSASPVELTIGEHLSCTVEQVLQSTGSIAIPEDKLVLSVNNNSSEWMINMLAALQPGDTVDIDITTPDSRWESAVTAIGGLYKMVTNGVVASGLETTQAPRTAVGIKADGTTVFYTVDGRQSGYSVGASMEQVAKRLVELGCVEAICLDGGGSTTLGASLPGQDNFAVLNQPSDGTQRAVTNALFLVADSAATGEPESLILSPADAILLTGTQLELSAASVDAIGQTVRTYPGSELTFAPSGAGVIENGVLTAGTQASSYIVTASADGLSGASLVTVVSTPDKITVQNEATGAAVFSVNLNAGDSINLTAGAVYRNLNLLCSDNAFTWSVTGGLGSIDQNGLLTAGETGGTGYITVTAGGRAVSIPLTVTDRPNIHTVETFEGDFLSMTNSVTAQVEPEQNPVYVRYGSQSAKVSYNTGGASAAVGIPLNFQEGEQYLSLWVYGDGSGNTLTAPVRLTDGSSSEQTLTALNFTGWRQITVPLPEGAAQVLVLKITATGTAASGAVWLDQVTTANQSVSDSTPPVVTITSSESAAALRATVQDNIDRSFSAGQVCVTYDGRALPFTLDGTVITAALPAQDGLAHRLTVTVTDASGNIGRASSDIAASSGRESPFSDTAGHWASEYINYLYDQNISTGVVVGSTLCFQPEKEITRGEFALMVARWMRLDLTQYSGVVLPFADTANIPSWCLNGIQAMYALGVMQGSAANGGAYAFAEKSITRAEAMTMLGRIQQKGYAGSELTFADAAGVPAWAADYVKVLVAQGVVNGYENNTIAPNASIKRSEMAKILYTMR